MADVSAASEAHPRSPVVASPEEKEDEEMRNEEKSQEKPKNPGKDLQNDKLTESQESGEIIDRKSGSRSGADVSRRSVSRGRGSYDVKDERDVLSKSNED